MNGRVPAENLNGGVNNQSRWASCLTGTLPACCRTALLVMTGQVAQTWLLSLYSKVPQCILWPGGGGGGTRCYIHNLLPLLALLDAGMVCLTPAGRVQRVFTDLWCVCVHGSEFIVQLFVCTAAGLSVTARVSGTALWKCVTGRVCGSAVKRCPAAPPGCQLRFTMLN